MTPRKRSYQGTAAPALRGLVFLVALTVGPACYAQQPLLQIASPSDGTTIDPGQTLTASVTSPANASFSGVFVISENPLHLPAAGVQADIVAHRMGGDIARTMALRPTFLGNSTYGEGTIHKMITIDTPHLGSEVASALISPQEDGGCVESLLASKGKFVFNSVSLEDTGLADGAVGDLSVSSPALLNIANQSPHPFFNAFIAGVNPTFLFPGAIGVLCSAVGDPLGVGDLSGTAWSSIFGGQPNDGIVSENSQLNGLAPTSGFVFSGVAHSAGIEGPLGLGFSRPNVLDPDSATGIPSTVIKLLNTPVTSAAFNLVNP